MKVIVIIVTYNGMKWYNNCFESLRNSSIPLNTIVIDNNSADNTVEFINENYPEIHLVDSKTNLGFGKANNIGFKYAIEQDADYVFLLNQDAWIYSDTIEILIQQAERNPQYGILSPLHLNGDQTSLDLYYSRYLMSEHCPNLISDHILNKHKTNSIYPIAFVNAAMWLISRKCFEEVGGFQPLFPHYGEDNNYIQRAHFHKMLVGIVPSTKGIHDREHEESSPISFYKKKKRAYISQLVLLLDINIIFSKAFRIFIINIFTELLRSFLFISPISFYINLSTLFKICFKTPQIIKARKQDKNKGLNYL